MITTCYKIPPQPNPYYLGVHEHLDRNIPDLKSGSTQDQTKVTSISKQSTKSGYLDTEIGFTNSNAKPTFIHSNDKVTHQDPDKSSFTKEFPDAPEGTPFLDPPRKTPFWGLRRKQLYPGSQRRGYYDSNKDSTFSNPKDNAFSLSAKNHNLDMKRRILRVNVDSGFDRKDTSGVDTEPPTLGSGAHSGLIWGNQHETPGSVQQSVGSYDEARTPEFSHHNYSFDNETPVQKNLNHTSESRKHNGTEAFAVYSHLNGMISDNGTKKLSYHQNIKLNNFTQAFLRHHDNQNLNRTQTHISHHHNHKSHHHVHKDLKTHYPATEGPKRDMIKSPHHSKYRKAHIINRAHGTDANEKTQRRIRMQHGQTMDRDRHNASGWNAGTSFDLGLEPSRDMGTSRDLQEQSRDTEPMHEQLQSPTRDIHNSHDPHMGNFQGNPLSHNTTPFNDLHPHPDLATLSRHQRSRSHLDAPADSENFPSDYATYPKFINTEYVVDREVRKELLEHGNHFLKGKLIKCQQKARKHDGRGKVSYR